jgi:thioredoxin-like negative regulator of GroEL
MTSVVALHFWSPTCNPCRVIKPAIDDLKEEFSQVEWVSINTHDDPKHVAQKFGVNVVPTIVVLKNNQEIGRHSGTQMGIYYSILRKALA